MLPSGCRKGPYLDVSLWITRLTVPSLESWTLQDQDRILLFNPLRQPLKQKALCLSLKVFQTPFTLLLHAWLCNRMGTCLVEVTAHHYFDLCNTGAIEEGSGLVERRPIKSRKPWVGNLPSNLGLLRKGRDIWRVVRWIFSNGGWYGVIIEDFVPILLEMIQNNGFLHTR